MSKNEKLHDGYLLSNEDIDRLFTTKYFNKKLNTYGGVYLHNELVELVPESKFYVVNIDREPSKNGGTHWVLIFNVHDKVIYMDPFGLAPSDIITSFMKRAQTKDNKKKTIFYTTTQIQDIDNTNCGFIVAWFARQLLKKRSIVNILNDFHVDFRAWLNDRLINQIKRSRMFAVL